MAVLTVPGSYLRLEPQGHNSGCPLSVSPLVGLGHAECEHPAVKRRLGDDFLSISPHTQYAARAGIRRQYCLYIVFCIPYVCRSQRCFCFSAFVARRSFGKGQK